MADVEGGKLGFDVVPDFRGFSSLFNQGVRGALTQADSLGKQAGKLFSGGVQQAVAVGFVGLEAAVGDFVLSGVRKLTEFADTARSVQRLTGASAEEASLYGGVLRHLGVDVDAANRGLGIFGANIAQHPKLFNEAGVAIAKNRDGTNDLLGTLDNLRKTMGATTDATARDAAAKQLLGRSYQTLLPYLSLTNDRLATYQQLARAGGEVVHQKDIDNAREMRIETQELADQWQRLQIAVGRPALAAGVNILSHGSATIPLLAGAIGELGHFDPVPLIELATGHSKAGAAARQHAADEKAAKDAIAQMGVQAAAQATALSSLSSAGEGVRSAQEGLANAQRAVASAERGVATAHQATQHAIEGVTKAEQGIVTARENSERATRDLASAQADLDKLLKQGAVDEKAVEEARRSVDSANRSARDSAEALATAEEHLAELQRGASADTLADARLALRSAQLAEARARYQLSQPSTSSDPFASQQASLALAEATQRRKEAQEALTTAQQKGTSSDADLADAEKAVRDAREHETDATQAQADAQQKLREAQAGDPEFDQKVADAKQKVADASLGVRDAEIGETDAANALRDAKQAVVDAKQGEVDAAAAVQRAHEQVTDATYNLRDANYKLQESWDEAVKSGVNLGDLLDTLKAKYPELGSIIQQFYADVTTAADVAHSVFDAARRAFGFGGGSGGTLSLPNLSPSGGHGPNLSPGGSGGPNLSPSGRAGGGDVVPGQLYRVNEDTPRSEYLTVDVPGHVYTQGQVGAVADQPLVLENHVHVILDSEEIEHRVSRRQLERRKALTGVQR